MSKASDWAAALGAGEHNVREVRAQKPKPIILNLGLHETIKIEVNESGNAVVQRHEVEAKVLCKVATLILDTFGEPDKTQQKIENV